MVRCKRTPIAPERAQIAEQSRLPPNPTWQTYGFLRLTTWMKGYLYSTDDSKAAIPPKIASP